MPLTAEERELIATFNDADQTWHIYSDSATMRGAILRLARQLGVELRRVEGAGVEFRCPADALKLTPKRRYRLSEEARAARRARALRHLHSIQPSEAKT